MPPQSARRISVFLLALFWIFSGTANAADITACVYHGDLEIPSEAHTNSSDHTQAHHHDHHPQHEAESTPITDGGHAGHDHSGAADCEFLCLAMTGPGLGEVAIATNHGVMYPGFAAVEPAYDNPILPRITLPFFLPPPNGPPS